MKKIVVVTAVVALIFACNQAGKKNPDEITQTVSPWFSFSYCDSANGSSLCSYLPYEVHQPVTIGYDSDLDSTRQPPFDIFSWQSFVALNWPADKNGNPLGNSISAYPSNSRVWEYYQDPIEVFGASNSELLLHLGDAKEANEKFLHLSSKSPGRLNILNGFEEADGHPLIDRNLNFALYEIKMSPAEVNFVTTNKLTTVDSIGTYYLWNKKQFALPPYDSASKTPGTTEIKASWRILLPSKGDDTTRYYCRNALVYVDAAHSRSGKSFVFKAKVGLVGIHIFRITTRFGLGIWSTFEHVDNTPVSTQQAQNVRNTNWSFYNPQCLNCPANDTPVLKKGEKVYKWDSAMPYAASYGIKAPSQPIATLFGTQAVREYPIYSATEFINRLWRAKLQGTVWANYTLIGSQWQNSESHPPLNAPALLANTTLETYIQKDASCISCHRFAAVNYIRKPGDTITVKTNLSFLFPVYAH